MVVLGLGSNLGHREVHLKRALNLLTRSGDAPLADTTLSRVYESPALVPNGAPQSWDRPFLNCALMGQTRLDPPALLAAIKRIEATLGRADDARWAPRLIDIDILWWPGMERSSSVLTIPHPELHRRPFALRPLAELAPDGVLNGVPLCKHPLAAPAAQGSGGGEDAGTQLAPEAEFRVRYPQLMGIVNVTPDSFSDGGSYERPDAALDHAQRLLAGGATILDVGAESTRPGGDAVEPGAEWGRLEPVLEGLRALQQERTFQISLDTRNARTAARALELGIDYLNDVTAFSDPAMLEVAQGAEVQLIFMHALSIPVKRREYIPQDRDVVRFITDWASDRLEMFDKAGIPGHRLILDPGIGFGKTPAQNSEILRRIAELHDVGLPLTVGHSRKYFGDIVADTPWEERDARALQVSDDLADAGVEILRLHEVANHDRRFRELFSAEFAENSDRRAPQEGRRPWAGLRRPKSP